MNNDKWNLDLLVKISEYASKHLETHTDKHDQTRSREKVFQNIVDGKIAEFSCYFKLKELGYELEKPDLKIYESGKKSFDADLLVTGKNNKPLDIHVHVKSLSINSQKFPPSFVVSENDDVVLKPRLNHFFVVMKQKDFLNYEIFRWVNSHDAKYSELRRPVSGRVACYL